MAHTIADGLRGREGYDPYADSRSLEYRLRQRRYRALKDMIDLILAARGRCRIIDLGGADMYWDISCGHIDDPRITIDLVNLEVLPARRPNVRSFVGDACDLCDFDDMSYDLVHSNSLIEHVGRWQDMLRMATNVRRLAPSYFVQTPYFWFPIEPHFRAPFFHWLPEPCRYRLILRRKLGYQNKAASVTEAMQSVQSASLLDTRQYATLFPDAENRRERILGLTKALIAVRHNSF